MEDLRSKGVEGCVVPPLTQVRGWRGDQLMLQAGGRGGGLERGWVLVGSWRAPKIMGARPHKMGARPHSERAPKIIGARPHPVGGLVISSSSSLQLRVDVFKIRSR